jgi:hypothetical protein
LAAGAAGTAAMTVYQTAVPKARGTEASTTPAEVGKRVIRGVFHRRFDEDRTELLNNAMHWGYGTSWGAFCALTDGLADVALVGRGLAFGTLVWSASLIELPAMKLAPPVWEYPPLELALDVSYHLAEPQRGAELARRLAHTRHGRLALDAEALDRALVGGPRSSVCPIPRVGGSCAAIRAGRAGHEASIGARDRRRRTAGARVRLGR